MECLELGGKVDGVGGRRVVAHVQGGNTDRITSGNDSGRGDGSVEQDEREHSIEHSAEVGSVLLVLEMSAWTLTYPSL